ncbi:hypothetical protein GGTG_05924 [Gaeumannomyces tritici R3-111a-1]|uniref:Heterokaryon incompatibility domain-containing protein n=1 Tax=Gaeumannomyces tritici (strain R3-111a-1) TaxID=644352 RepID=J3NXB7_GAET3|nr:hypothetical protein GGTG_05924 [Gaeumannomyces tritici R3-111a-1]EJT75999.1 hypothetical protein GGTG_05924 [Gaeumannomyces tritici R3-111a-1]
MSRVTSNANWLRPSSTKSKSFRTKPSRTPGGNPSPGFEISLNGLRHAVTPNLYKALQCLRHQDTDRILWIDAICIDQGNHIERGHQVGQMRLIYQNADRVLIWLGPGTSTTDLVMDWVKRLDQRVVSRPDHIRSSTASWYQAPWHTIGGLEDEDGKVGEATPGLPHTRRRSPVLTSLYHSPWFHRVWVIQEAASARAATIMYGRKWAPSRTFSILPKLMGIDVDAGTQAVLDIMPGPLRGSSWRRKKRDLATLIGKFYGCQASDPRDKIYALLGTCSDSIICENLRPDYNLSREEVIQKTFTLILLPITDVSLANLWRLPSGWDFEAWTRKIRELQRNIIVWSLFRDDKALSLALLSKLPTNYILEEFSPRQKYWYFYGAGLQRRDQMSDSNGDLELRTFICPYPAVADTTYRLLTSWLHKDTFPDDNQRNRYVSYPEFFPFVYIALREGNYDFVRMVFNRFAGSVYIEDEHWDTWFDSLN